MKTLLLTSLLATVFWHGIERLLASTPPAPPALIPTSRIEPPPPAEAVATALVDGINAGLADRLARFRNLWETLWSNPRATPAEILEELDTRAGLVFAAAAAGLQDITRMAELAGTTPEALLGDAKYLSPAQPITVHPDGRVTLTPP